MKLTSVAGASRSTEVVVAESPPVPQAPESIAEESSPPSERPTDRPKPKKMLMFETRGEFDKLLKKFERVEWKLGDGYEVVCVVEAKSERARFPLPLKVYLVFIRDNTEPRVASLKRKFEDQAGFLNHCSTEATQVSFYAVPTAIIYARRLSSETDGLWPDPWTPLDQATKDTEK